MQYGVHVAPGHMTLTPHPQMMHNSRFEVFIRETVFPLSQLFLLTLDLGNLIPQIAEVRRALLWGGEG